MKKNIYKGETADKQVFSIDVPVGTDPNIIYPEAEDGHPKKTGRNCYFPYIQLFGNSINFNFSKYYPIEAWFIDGKHNYEYTKIDTEQALKSNPKLIIWHDVQIPDVESAVAEVMAQKNNYELYRISDTRIAFAVKI